MCPNDTIRFECTAQKTPDERTYWTLSVSYVGGYCKDFVYVGQTAPLGSSICTDSTWILDCESLLGLSIVNFNVTDTPPDTNGTCLGSELTLCLSSDYIITGVKAICANTSVPFEGIPYLSYGETSINVTIRPNPPVDVSAETTRGSQANLTVLWTAPSTGYGPTSYSISVEGGSVAPVVIQATAALQYSYRFSGLRNDRLYTVSVVAINCGGMSDPVRLIPANSPQIGAIVGITAGTIAASLLLMTAVIAGARKAYKGRTYTLCAWCNSESLLYKHYLHSCITWTINYFSLHLFSTASLRSVDVHLVILTTHESFYFTSVKNGMQNNVNEICCKKL